MEKEPEKEKGNSESKYVRERSTRIVDHKVGMPPSVPMVFSVRSYVRAVRMPPLNRDWDGGQIANRAPDEPSCPVAE